jgi:hypothetical protein
MRDVLIEEWRRTLWKALVKPWGACEPLREQRVRHLILSDWLEERGHLFEAQIIREGRWYLWLDRESSRYALSEDSPQDWGGPLAIHWWPRAYSDPALMHLADLDDCLLDSELWTIRTP